MIIMDGTVGDLNPPPMGAVWLIVSADGIPRPFSTTACGFSNHLTWNFPARLILQFNDVSRSYMYVTLCTHGMNGTSVEVLGRSRIGLRALPIGSPKVFEFPIMHPSNSAQVVLNCRIKATLSSITASYAKPPNAF